MIRPHTPGEVWVREVHGAFLQTSAHWWSLYDADNAWFATFCEKNGIPTGAVIDAQVADLAKAAYAASGAEREALLRRAHELLRPAMQVAA
jgi:hypothetical protein